MQWCRHSAVCMCTPGCRGAGAGRRPGLCAFSNATQLLHWRITSSWWHFFHFRRLQLLLHTSFLLFLVRSLHLWISLCFFTFSSFLPDFLLVWLEKLNVLGASFFTKHMNHSYSLSDRPLNDTVGGFRGQKCAQMIHDDQHCCVFCNTYAWTKFR